MKDSIKNILIVLIFMAIAMTALFACSQNSDKPSPETNSGSPASSSQEDVSSSYYDDDWYQSFSSSMDACDQSSSISVNQSSEEDNSQSIPQNDDSGVSYEEGDDSNWTPYL